MNAPMRGVGLLLPLLAVIVCGQNFELNGRLLGTVVDRSGRPVPVAKIVLYEIGHDDSTAETQPNAQSGEFEMSVRRDRVCRLVATSVCMTSKAIERVNINSIGDTHVPPIMLEVMDCGQEGPLVTIPAGFGDDLVFKTEHSPEELRLQLALMSLPLTKSTIDLHLLFPPIEFQPEIKGAQTRNRRPKPSGRVR